MKPVWVLLALAALPAAGQVSPPYAGSETCSACHEDIYNAFAKSPHHLVDNDAQPGWKGRGWKGRACESCHGPAQKHTESADAKDIQNPGKLAAAAADKICLTCHLNQPTQVGRLQSSHAKDQVSCTSCHKVHANGPDGLVVRKPAAINEQCASCHLNVWAQFQRPNHHKLPEGAMSCVDCHNPHGSIRPAMTQVFGANEPGCLNCHGDKRGPFTFEHGPVRFEGCATCHEAAWLRQCPDAGAAAGAPGMPGMPRQSTHRQQDRHHRRSSARISRSAPAAYFRTARCATRKFTEVTWTGIC